MTGAPAISVQTRALSWLRRNPFTDLSCAACWLLVVFLLCWLLELIPGGWGRAFSWLQFFTGAGLLVLAVPLLVRLVRQRMLWSLRNKLIITYLLIGLAPMILFATLVLISGYIAAGQFAIHLANSRIQTELDQMNSDTPGLTVRIVHAINTQVAGKPEERRQEFSTAERAAADEIRGTRLRPQLETFIDGVPQPMPGGPSPSSRILLGLPAWAANLKGGKFSGLVVDGDDLYLVAVQQERLADGRLFTLASHIPVNGAFMDIVARGFGRVVIFAHRALGDQTVKERGLADRFTAISGGIERPPRNIADIRVRFLSTTSVTDWATATVHNVPLEVDSRPGLLYLQLFGESLGSNITSAIRTSFIVLCVLFALIEILAFTMAIRLSRTMTASVADLYEATLSIDRGELDHRIEVSRTDQLAELSRAFNRMAVSLQRLLVEQHEKERLQNELAIAQEVQANLFPTATLDLPTLELHGVCRPARSVSGDYYDFIVFHEEDQESQSSRVPAGVGIVLGDISGKGISAALLMATLHSAVRAYSFASEQVVYASSLVTEPAGWDGDSADPARQLFESPGRVMSLLNRHLYRSTQPEKYATLFLAHYDMATSWLTYSNAGHPHPILLSHDGSVQRLDEGGTVVGLLDGMRYDEGRFQMQSGDILVAYSDGVTEPEKNLRDFGEARLIDVVIRHRDQPLHVISAQVMQALDEWIGSNEQPDDITLVLARQI